MSLAIKFRLKKLLLSPLPIRVQLIVWLMKKFKLGGFRQRLLLDAVPRPGYAYGMYSAAIQAKELGYKRVSAIEFGVAIGNGLVDMQNLANEIESEVGITFELYGFDSGSGLPVSSDYRNQLYYWPQGSFHMIDTAACKARLNRSELILGDVEETTGKFFSEHKPAPVGFVSFDLDYYTSTKAAFNIFNHTHKSYLPRVECFMDDVSSYEILTACQGTGVLKAISEFNEESDRKKIYKKEHVSRLRHFVGQWNDCMYVYHRFDHPEYSTFVAKSY
jgi:hypothetical protein